MADVEINEVAVGVAEKEVTSSVKESPVKETNGSAKVVAEEKNGTGDNGVAKEDAPKENGDSKEADVKENGDKDEVCTIKRKSCSAEVDAVDVPTPEKKAKLLEEEADSPAVVEDSNDGEAVEA